jgi:signal transduction histidine kinase
VPARAFRQRSVRLFFPGPLGAVVDSVYSRRCMPAMRVSWSAPVATGLAEVIGLHSSGRRAGWSGRLSLTWQFRWASLLILAFAMLGVGAIVSHQAESSTLHRTAALTALYVDSALSDPLASLATQPRLGPSEIATLDHLLRTTALGERLVDLRVWSPTGEVLYSSTQELIGQRYPVSDKLARALRGWVVADLTWPGDDDNTSLRTRSGRLLEVYAPLRQEDGDGRVLAVIEFHQRPDDLLDEIAADRLRSWTLVGTITGIVYLLLAGIVERGSAVIARQQAALRSHVRELHELHERLRHAAERTTTLNEQAMRRIGADLHAGPGQALALALLRLDAIHPECDCGCLAVDELETVRGAISQAMRDVRAIAAGLRLPELAALGPAEVVRRVVRTHEQRTGVPVALQVGELPDQAPPATKIVLFRALEEALANARRHGQAASISVRAWLDADALAVCVTDHGPGFAPERAFREGHPGLANSRERAELLGGRLRVDSAPGAGTRVSIWLPLRDPDPER